MVAAILFIQVAATILYIKKMAQFTKRIFLFLAISFSVMGAYGNGMGTYIISAATRSSDPICREIKDITLLSENLNIRLTTGWSHVTVKYILWNNSDKDYIDIDYAFPMDYASSDNSLNNKEPDIGNIYFSMDGQSLPYVHSDDKYLEDVAVSWGSFAMIRRWYYTKISVKKNSFTTLEVRYSLKNFHICDGDSPAYIDNDSSGCNGRSFLYDFSPASSWGDGIIRDFYVEVDAQALYLSGDIPSDYSIENNRENDYPLFMVKGLDFVQEGGRFVYKTRNYDLHKTNSLSIAYTTFNLSSLDMITKYRIPNDMYTVTASSGQKKYPLSNLTDINLETAWVPVKDVGDWVEFTFKKPIRGLAGYTIVNGYHKNEDTYTQNNRVKKYKIEILQPEREWQTMEWNDEFEDRPYKPMYFENLFSNYGYRDFFDSYDGSYPVQKIRFTIEEVYPGSKYNDTCISEIILFKINIQE